MPRAEELGLMTSQNLPDRFFDEAKLLLDREQGRASIPTIQALLLMYLTLSCQGKDRAGRMYRQIAVDMTRRLRLEARYRFLSTEMDANGRDAELVAKALWGLFLFEAYVEHLGLVVLAEVE